jgi:hypothetical protein
MFFDIVCNNGETVFHVNVAGLTFDDIKNNTDKYPDGVDVMATIIRNAGQIFHYWDIELRHSRAIRSIDLANVLDSKWLFFYCADTHGWNARMKDKI